MVAPMVADNPQELQQLRPMRRVLADFDPVQRVARQTFGLKFVHQLRQRRAQREAGGLRRKLWLGAQQGPNRAGQHQLSTQRRNRFRQANRYFGQVWQVGDHMDLWQKTRARLAQARIDRPRHPAGVHENGSLPQHLWRQAPCPRHQSIGETRRKIRAHGNGKNTCGVARLKHLAPRQSAWPAPVLRACRHRPSVRDRPRLSPRPAPTSGPTKGSGKRPFLRCLPIPPE